MDTRGTEDVDVLTGKVTVTSKSEVKIQLESLSPVKVNSTSHENDDRPTRPLVTPRSVSESNCTKSVWPLGENETAANVGVWGMATASYKSTTT